MAGEGTPVVGRGTTAPRTAGPTGNAGGGVAAEAAGVKPPIKNIHQERRAVCGRGVSRMTVGRDTST